MCLPPFSMELTLLHSEQPKLNGVLAVLSATGLNSHDNNYYYYMEECAPPAANSFLYEYMYTAFRRVCPLWQQTGSHKSCSSL